MQPDRQPSSSPPPLVSIRDAVLEFRIGQSWRQKRNLRVLDEISLDIAPGEIVALVGESGSGKTTLGKAILGLHPLTSGTITVASATAADHQVRHDLQMVFQDPLSSFNPRFTIGSSIALPLTLHRRLSSAEADREVKALLSRVGLSAGFANRFPHEMSGGQLQRAAMARALGLSPRLIIADEAVSKLDVSVRAQILNLIKSLSKSANIAIVFITHDLGVASFLADRVAVMYFGRIVELGSAKQVMNAPRHPYTFMLTNARKEAGDATDDAKPNPVGCNFSTRCPNALDICHTQRPVMGELPSGALLRCFNPIRCLTGAGELEVLDAQTDKHAAGV